MKKGSAGVSKSIFVLYNWLHCLNNMHRLQLKVTAFWKRLLKGAYTVQYMLHKRPAWSRRDFFTIRGIYDVELVAGI